jgi:uncharacterized protein (TIGR03435 family)
MKAISLVMAAGLMVAVSGGAWGWGSAPQHGARHESPGEPVEVRITPSRAAEKHTSEEAGEESWSESGVELRTLLAQMYGVEPGRVEFADVTLGAMGDRRYDVELRLPEEESDAAIEARIEKAIEKKFHVAMAVESRPMDVDVVTAPNGAGAELKPDKTGGGAIDSQVMLEDTAMGSGTPDKAEIARLIAARQAASGVSLTGIEMTAGTIADFCRTLERAVDRPVVDETGLTGRYDLDVKGYANRDELFAMLRERFGLVVTPARREVKFLVVRAE